MAGLATQEQRRSGERLQRLLAGYRPQSGVFDELLDADGRPRPHWSTLLNTLADHTGGELEARFATADRYLRDSGVFYRVQDDPTGGERPWPLAHVPLVIPAAEWRGLERGLIQRARLLDAVLDDVFGPGQLIKDGALPATLVAGNREFHPALRGVPVKTGRRLAFYAADLGRGPDGRWWVLSDRAQAPSGSGYALENRIALAGAFADLFGRLSVERLAPFFQAFRDGLAAASGRDEPRIGVLTPGPLNETYFEHAYLARYLGFVLVEGGDLVENDGTIYVRTVEGLKRADVLLRRLDTDFADPLELNAASHIGVPGLVEAIRRGTLTLANSLGSGFVESPALMSFLPGLARRLLKEELILPSVATWWCGQPQARETVRAEFDARVIGSAFGRRIPVLPGQGGTIGADLDGKTRADILEWMERRGVDLVAQEVVHLSTMPVWQAGRLVARPFVLRAYVAATDDGYAVMPGGFCRVSDTEDARAISMGSGARATDVWVLSDKPVEAVSLLPAPDKVRVHRANASLPSRAADNLFWLGRYWERTDITLRLVRALSARLSEAVSGGRGGASATKRLIETLVGWDAVPAALAGLPANVPMAALTEAVGTGSALVLAREARRAASAIRERLSGDTLRPIDELVALLDAARSDEELTPPEAHALTERAMREIAALNGFIFDSLNRRGGWRFIDVGRRIERAVAIARLTRQFGEPTATPDMLDLILEITDSQITYRRRYLFGAARLPILDLALLDPAMPRSVAFQVNEIVAHLAALPLDRTDGMLEPCRRLAQRLAAELATQEAGGIDRTRILGFEQQVMQLSDEFSSRFFRQNRLDGSDVKGLT